MKKKEFISVRLFGGLGNQIFQYLAGKSLALDRKLPLFIDNNWLQDGYGHKNSSISEFQLYEPDLEYGTGHKSSFQLYVDRLATIASRNIPLVARLTRINSPKSNGYQDFNGVPSGFQLRGYYQSPNYFLKLVNSGFIDKASFELKKPSINYHLHCNLFSTEGFLAVHVRGGDYLKKNAGYIHLDRAYYLEAIETIINQCGKLPIWVFTDDIDYAKQVLFDFSDLSFLDNHQLTAAESMKLMSMASGIVSANSTFSYWAGMISKPTTTVVAPRLWMNRDQHSEEFFPRDWKLI